MGASETEATTPAGELAPGTEIDHFKLIRLIGRGGMGEVYLARDEQLGRRVALKLVHADALGDEMAVKRFLREAQITARFSHPHIVTIYSVGEYEGSPYLALEYLSGQTLRQRIDEDRPGLKEALRLGLAIAEALREAHQHKVLHRDLKPGNVLVPKDGRVRVLDFGLSRTVPEIISDTEATLLAGDVAATQTLHPYDDDKSVIETRGGGIKGTPAYMAPEQWNEQEGTVATDIWALGLILYELVSGVHPFAGMNFYAICLAVGQSDPVPSVGAAATELPLELVSLIDQCLIKAPDSRATTDYVVETLSGMLSNAPQRSASTTIEPFRGLLPFSERHADRFFGRDSEIASCLERLREESLMPVVGPSGAGKSSFVQAGIIPRLREQGFWIVLSLRPGRRPFDTLAARLMTGESLPADRSTSRPRQVSSSPGAPKETLEVDMTLPAGSTIEPKTTPTAGVDPLPRFDGEGLKRQSDELQEAPARLALLLAQLAETRRARVLLFVDQLEELFTLVESEQVRRSFMQALSCAADDPSEQVKVIFTLRDDFLGRLATAGLAPEALGRVQVLGTPGTSVLTEILQRPVKAAGYQYDDPGLVQEMVQAVRGEPAALPLLQFVGQTLWDHRDREKRLLTRQAYENAGGVAGALAKQADGVLQGMAPAQVQIARQIFLRLVTPDGTRRVVPQSQLMEGLGSDAEGVLQTLTRERTILGRKGLQEAELELVHESLIKTWARLAGWLDESRDERSFLTEAQQAAELWERRNRPHEEVWQGDALHDALRRAARCSSLPAQVDKFLEAGKRRDDRRLRHRRAFFAGGAGLLILAVVASLVVSWTLSKKEQAAQKSEREAQSQRRQAVSERAEALREGARAALMRRSLIEARAKLRGSLETKDSPLARALWWRLQSSELFWQRNMGGIVYALAFSPSGDRIAVACQDHSIYVLNKRTGAAHILRGHRDQVASVAFSPDSKSLASGSLDGIVRVWELGTTAVRVLDGHKGGILSVSFSPDGKLLASASMDRTIRLWRVQTGRIRSVLRGHKAQVRSVRFSPDGSVLASGSVDRTVRLWRVDTGATQAVLRGHTRQVLRVAFHPKGAVLASASADQTVRLWNVSTGAHRQTLTGHKGGVFAVDFSPDGNELAAGDQDGKLRIWDWKSRKVRQVLDAHKTSVGTLAYSPDGKIIATGGYDRAIRLWRRSGVQSTGSPSGGHDNGVVGLSFSSDGRQVATAGLDSTVRVWNVTTGQPEQILRGHHRGVYTVRFSPDGKLLASGSTDRTVRLWSVAAGHSKRVLRGHGSVVTDVAFSPDGKTLASASYDKTIRLWSVDTGRLLRVIKGHTGPVRSVIFSPDGKTLASASYDKTIRLWSVGNGQALKVLTGHSAKVTGIAFGAGGKTLISGSWDKSVRLWEVDKGTQRTVGRCPGRVYWVALHPGGKLVGASCSDGTARTWNLVTGKEQVFRGHQGEVNFLQFSPDGKLTATTSDDATLRIWRTATGVPFWRAPILLRASVELLTHRGWKRLDNAAAKGLPNRRWRQAVVALARRASVSADDTLLCLETFDDHLEIWDLRTDRSLVRSKLSGLQRVLAIPGGCATLAAGSVRLYNRQGAFRELMSQATGIHFDHGKLLISAGTSVHAYSAQGTKLQSVETGTGVVAITQTPRWLVIGFQDGNIELVPTQKGQHKPVFTFEDVPSSKVTRLVPGPTGTLIAGFANGHVGLWTLHSGKRLEYAKLHGTIDHLLLTNGKLYAASDLGQHLLWDLSAFYQSYCKLLKNVWQHVPVLWESGLPTLRVPPRGHRCAGK